MKKISLLLIVIAFIGIGINLSCEADDICPESTPTTPSLIMEAYDTTITENKKNIPNLLVAGVDNENVLPGYGIVSAPKIILPLKTDANTTQYVLIRNAAINNNSTPDDTSDDTIDGNYDTITINYTREEVYVSRACGYKTIYKNVTVTIEPDTDNWIKSIIPVNENQSIEDETETHFNIYH